VHTNDAAGAVTRLIDLGLEPFMVASSLVGVVSVRLVRKLCTRCREPYEAGAASLNRFGHAQGGDGKVTLYRGRGCKHCLETGYYGRTGIFEVLDVNDSIRALILSNSSDQAIRQAAIESGMRSIGEDGLKKVLTGETTLEEVTRSVYLEEQGARVCPQCRTVLVQEYAYCTGCGEFVGEHCESCRRRFNPEWDFCPFCGAGRAAKRGGAQAGVRAEAPDDRESLAREGARVGARTEAPDGTARDAADQREPRARDKREASSRHGTVGEVPSAPQLVAEPDGSGPDEAKPRAPRVIAGTVPQQPRADAETDEADPPLRKAS
jgi:hypothetical protein